MLFNDEKDYIMRIIKESVRLLISLLLGKKYDQAELPEENKYAISGKTLDEYKEMIDRGDINEAENLLLENIDYGSKEEVVGAVFFYEYISKKDEIFLQQHDYSQEEVLEGLKNLAQKAGYEQVCDFLE